MEFRIIHGPAVPQNDLQFVKAGTLQVTPQAVQLGGKWRTMTPAKPSTWTFIMPLLFIAALSTDSWLPQAWQAVIGNTALGILKFIIYLSYIAFFLLQSVPLSKKITAGREALREIARSGRELTFLFRDRKGRERHALFNTDNEEEAAAIETALRDSGTEQTFIITYGPAAARPIMPVPGQIVIGPESVHLEGRIPRDPYPDRRRMRKVSLVTFFVVMLIVLVPVILITSSMSSGSAFISPEIFIGITTAAMILLMVVAIIYGACALLMCRKQRLPTSGSRGRK